MSDPSSALQAVFDATPTPLLEVDPEGKIRRANRACGALLGYNVAELSGQEVETLIDEPLRPAHRRNRQYFAADAVARPMGDGRPVHALRADGVALEVEVQLTPVGDRVLVALSDLSDRRKLEAELGLRTQQLELAQRRLEELALVDPVTGARNRAAFFDDLGARLALSVRQTHPLSVAVVDVDGFRQVNKALGEPAGDELLRRLAAIVRYTARRSDLVARTGDDVFAVILPETDADGGACFGERVRAAVADAAWPHGPMTVCVGVETYVPEPGQRPASVDDLSMAVHRRAREALQRAKEAGRDRVVHTRDL